MTRRLALALAALVVVAGAAGAGLAWRARAARRAGPTMMAPPRPVPAVPDAPEVDDAAAAAESPFVPGTVAWHAAAGELDDAAAAAGPATPDGSPDPDAPPALLLAADWGDAGLPLVQALLARGADPRATWRDGRTALHLAARAGAVQIAAALLQAGADDGALSTELGTPLAAAAADGQLEIVAALLRRGAADDVRPPLTGTALARAAAHGRGEVVAALLESGPRRDRASLSAALVEAAAAGARGAAALLLAAGASADERAPDGRTPLAAAAAAGHADVATLLLDHGAHPDTRTAEGELPAVAAGRRGHGAVVDLLLGRGAAVPQDPVQRALLGRAERRGDGRLVILHPAPTAGAWDGPVWFGQSGLELRIPAVAFGEPSWPDWNGQVLAQTHGLVEGDAIGVLGRDALVTATVGPLCAPGADGASAVYHAPLLAGGAPVPGIPVHPAFLEGAAAVVTRGTAHGDAPASCRPLPPAAGSGGGACDVVEFALGARALAVDVLEPEEGDARWVRVRAGAAAGPWLDLPRPGGEQLRVAAWVAGRDGAADRLVLATRGTAGVGMRVLRVGPGLALEAGRPWRYPPPGAGL